MLSHRPSSIEARPRLKEEIESGLEARLPSAMECALKKSSSSEKI